MTGEATYAYLVEMLEKEMLKAYPNFTRNKKGYGAFDKIAENSKIAHLRGLFKDVICDPDRPVLYSRPGDGLYIFNGRFYENIGDGADFLAELVERTLKKLNVGSLYQMCASDKIARSLIRTACSSERFMYNPDCRYVGFTNGIFDLKDGALKPFGKDKCPRIVLDIEYTDPKTHYTNCATKYGTFENPCKRWESFICEVIPNRQFREALQCFCGAMLAPRDMIKIEYMACIYGPGSNGKSVLAESIAKVFGKEYYSTFTPAQLFKQGSNSMFCVADLDGKILNLTGDLDKADFSSGEFKSFASGEDVRARSPFGKKFKFVKPPMMLCCTNHLPKTDDDSQGYHRRILPILSTEKMYVGAERDTRLTYKLTQPDARCFIFSWIYEGYRKVMRNNGDIPLGADVRNACEHAMNQSNSMRRWWGSGECRWRKPEQGEDGEWIALKNGLYADYLRWCGDWNEKPFQPTEFGRMLRSLGYSEEKGNVKKVSFGMAYLVKRRETETEETISDENINNNGHE